MLFLFLLGEKGAVNLALQMFTSFWWSWWKALNINSTLNIHFVFVNHGIVAGNVNTIILFYTWEYFVVFWDTHLRRLESLIRTSVALTSAKQSKEYQEYNYKEYANLDKLSRVFLENLIKNFL